jgi:hypothetical protein
VRGLHQGEIGELHCAVGKLTTGSIGAKEGRVGVFHGEQEPAVAMACGGSVRRSRRRKEGKEEEGKSKKAKGDMLGLNRRKRRIRWQLAHWLK